MFNAEERRLNAKKIISHEKKVKAAKEAKENMMKFHKVRIISDFINAFNTTRKTEKRLPLLLRTNKTTLEKADVISLIKEKINPLVEEFDLRELSIKFRNPKERKQLKEVIKQKFIKVIKGEGILLFNIDDSPSKYDDLYDPELSDMFGGRIIFENIWKPEIMTEKECWKRFAGSPEIPQPNYSVSNNIL